MVIASLCGHSHKYTTLFFLPTFANCVFHVLVCITHTSRDSPRAHTCSYHIRRGLCNGLQLQLQRGRLESVTRARARAKFASKGKLNRHDLRRVDKIFGTQVVKNIIACEVAVTHNVIGNKIHQGNLHEFLRKVAPQ